MTERFENLFARLAQRREGAFVPFVNLSATPIPRPRFAVLETLRRLGADALELGIPFSDSVRRRPRRRGLRRQGPRQRRHARTLPRRTAQVQDRTSRDARLPHALHQPVAAPDVRRFMQAAADAGADAVLIP